jgi:hypothetical protein
MSYPLFLPSIDRRRFLTTSATTVGAVTVGSALMHVVADDTLDQAANAPETLVKLLYDSFSPKQKEIVCFDWEHVDAKRGLLRTRVENNWKVTSPSIKSDFYTKQQQSLVREIFEGIIHPDWHARFDRQLTDDMGGFGLGQSAAIFGLPGSDRFEFVLTGRHTTLRCDGNTTEHMAFGGPIFYGHAAGRDDELKDHPGNVFWEQAVSANEVYKMLDGKQRKLAEVALTPSEDAVAFRGPEGDIAGIPISELSVDQKQMLLQTLKKLAEPFRSSDRDEVSQCIERQGGIDRLRLAFYTDEDVGNDRVWDNWRLEGPSFVWHFRGSPHVHVWVNIADSPTVQLNA